MLRDVVNDLKDYRKRTIFLFFVLVVVAGVASYLIADSLSKLKFRDPADYDL